MSRFSGSFSALKHRNFRLFVVGQFISLVGFWMQSVGQSWLVYRLTHSAAYLGAVNFAQQFPILLFGLLAGGLVDRVNQHRLVILTQSLALVQAAVGLGLLLSGGRPGSDLHFLYGVTIVLTVPLVASYIADKQISRVLAYGLASLFMAGLAFRALTTGQL